MPSTTTDALCRCLPRLAPPNSVAAYLLGLLGASANEVLDNALTQQIMRDTNLHEEVRLPVTDEDRIRHKPVMILLKLHAIRHELIRANPLDVLAIKLKACRRSPESAPGLEYPFRF